MGSIPTRLRQLRAERGSAARAAVLVLAAGLLGAMAGTARAAESAADTSGAVPGVSAPAPVAPAPVAPAGPPDRGAPPDSARRGPRPFRVMLQSAVLPGWGQVQNGAWLKAVAVVAGEGYLAWRAWDGWQDELDATDRANAAAEAGDTDAYFRYLADRDRHENTKINYIWWAAGAHLFQMVDAYVDAHFTNFDADFGPDDAAGPGAGPRLTLALRARF